MALKDKEKRKAYDKAYRELKKDNIKSYYEANKERIKERDKAYKIKNKDEQRERRIVRHLKYKYNLTPEQRQAMIEAQGHMCKICRISFISLTDKQIATDHCHKRDAEGKKAVRGILCHKCNTILGFVKDNPKILRAAAKYLEDFEKSQQPKQLSLLGEE